MSKTFEARKIRAESFRVPIDCTIDLRASPTEDWRRRSATNISMSGMFIRTVEMLPKGTDVEVKFELQDGQPPIRGKADVLWCRERDAGPDRPQGVGVRFIDLDLDSKYAISRLVDRYQQLGRMPFDLSPPEDKPGLSIAPDRRLGVLALAFLAGAAAGVAGSLWLTGVAGEREGATRVAVASELTPEAPAQTEPPQTEPAAPIEEPATASAVSQPPPEPPPVAPADDLATAVEAAVVDWAGAWEAKDVERYLESYSDDFQPASGQTLDVWKAQRRQRLARSGAVEVRVSALEIEFLAADRALARFDQSYAAPGYRDRVRKELGLVWWARKWRIVREEVLAELPVG